MFGCWSFGSVLLSREGGEGSGWEACPSGGLRWKITNVCRRTVQHCDSRDGLATVSVACSTATVRLIVTPYSLVIRFFRNVGMCVCVCVCVCVYVCVQTARRRILIVTAQVCHIYTTCHHVISESTHIAAPSNKHPVPPHAANNVGPSPCEPHHNLFSVILKHFRLISQMPLEWCPALSLPRAV